MKKTLLLTLAGLLLLLWKGYDMATDRKRGPRWQLLLPETREKALELERRANAAGLDVMFYDGWRDIEDQESKITAGASSVSNPLNSGHPWGIAVDFVFRDAFIDIPGFQHWPDSSDPRWQKLGEIGEAVGFFWGGRYKHFFDGPHFMLPNYKPSQLRQAYNDNPTAFLNDSGVILA